jgi:hypothetical protein
VTPVEGRQQEQAVPAYALSKSTSWLADAARRSSGKMPSQQNRAQVLGDCDRADSEKALAQAKKENAALLKKLKHAAKKNKVLAAERETLSGAVGDKGLTKGVQLMSRLIESTPRKMAPKQEQYEKSSKRLQRNATHRKKVIGKLQGRLQSTMSELGKLRDRNTKAPRKVQNTKARSLLLRDQCALP